MGKIVWAAITLDKKCLLRTKSNNQYILTLENEEYSPSGERYGLATFNVPDFDLSSIVIKISEQVKKLYYSDKLPELKLSKSFKGTQEEIREYIKEKSTSKEKEEKQKDLILDDSLYVIMTSDKKCIVRGRKNTKFVLSTLDEKCNYKVFTCRQAKLIVNGMNDKHRHSWVYLTDNVKELYKTNKGIYDTETLPELIAVRAQTQYKIQL